MSLYYTAREGRCGDFIPFYWQGTYHLYYLSERSWLHLSTDDWLHFAEHGVAIASGGADAQDWMVATGSVVASDGLFYTFYCGANPDLAQFGRLTDVLLRATSPDLHTWTKDPDWRLEPDLGRHRPVAWRDPYVFWHDGEACYWMLVTTQERAGYGANLVEQRRTGLGCVALFTSLDLDHWQEREPIWTPGLYDAPECPDLFRIDDWWYLVFSEYRDIWRTHYRMAHDPAGPWLAPADDGFDARAFYAAKTASDGVRRFLVGWSCEKEGAHDAGSYGWGGSLLVHELHQRADGTLAAGPTAELAASFDCACPLCPQPRLGDWRVEEGACQTDARRSFACLRLAELPSGDCQLCARLSWTPEAARVGVILRMDEGLNDGYLLTLEPRAGRLTLDRWLRPWDETPLERPLHLAGHSAELRILLSGSEVVAYVDDDVALSGRAYDLTGGAIGLFAAEGEATFSAIQVQTRTM